MAYGSSNTSRRDYSTRAEENLAPVRLEAQVDNTPPTSPVEVNLPENIKVFPLEKETYVANSLKDNINTDFSEFSKPPIDEDIEQFFQIYRELFYDIPKRGEQSHTTLIEDSKNYFEDYVDPKDTRILVLNNKIEELQQRIEQEFSTQQHPFYSDGSILHITKTFTGIMQNGRLREIPNYDLFLRWYRAQPYFDNRGLEENVHFFRPKDDFTPIAGIPRGPIIEKMEDFNDYNYLAPLDLLTFSDIGARLQQLDLTLDQINTLRSLLNDQERAEGLRLSNNLPRVPAGLNETQVRRDIAPRISRSEPNGESNGESNDDSNTPGTPGLPGLGGGGFFGGGFEGFGNLPGGGSGGGY